MIGWVLHVHGGMTTIRINIQLRTFVKIWCLLDLTGGWGTCITHQMADYHLAPHCCGATHAHVPLPSIMAMKGLAGSMLVEVIGRLIAAAHIQRRVTRVAALEDPHEYRTAAGAVPFAPEPRSTVTPLAPADRISTVTHLPAPGL